MARQGWANVIPAAAEACHSRSSGNPVTLRRTTKALAARHWVPASAGTTSWPHVTGSPPPRRRQAGHTSLGPRFRGDDKTSVFVLVRQADFPRANVPRLA